MRRRGIILACLLGFAGGVLIGHGWAGRESTLWLPGALTAGLGALLLVRLVQRSPLELLPRVRAGHDAPAAPPLGRMLVGCGLITEAELAQALERQSRTKRRLGQVLVEMKLVSSSEVADVLEEQWSRRQHGQPTAAVSRPANRKSARRRPLQAGADGETAKPEVIVRPDPGPDA